VSGRLSDLEDVDRDVPLESIVAGLHRLALTFGLGLGVLIVDISGIGLPDPVAAAGGVATIALPWLHPLLLERARSGDLPIVSDDDSESDSDDVLEDVDREDLEQLLVAIDDRVDASRADDRDDRRRHDRREDVDGRVRP
jgi:hypothetical protein